jgi:hypothetical protein
MAFRINTGLPQAGLSAGQMIGSAFGQLGGSIGGMLTRGGEAIREGREAESAQQEFQQLLAANQNNPDALRTAGQQMMTNRDPNMQRLGKMLVDEANRVEGVQTKAEEKRVAATTGRGTGELLALANDPAFNLNDAKMRSGYLGMADSYGISRGDAMRIALEAQKSKTQGGSSFRQEIFEPTSGTMQQVNFLMDSSGRVVGQQLLGASAGPEKPEISIQKEEGVFYVFEDGIPVSEYESRAAAEAAAKEKNKANDAILKAQRVKLSISDAIGMIENNDNVGGWKQLLKYLPDTEARRFENYLTSIKANVGFDQLLSIKDAGSTLGQVSNIENLLLQSTIDSLDGLMSKDDLVQALNKIDAFYTSLITKAKFGPDAKLKDWAGSVDWMQPEFARMYEQQGGEIVVNENEGTILIKAPNGETIKLLR